MTLIEALARGWTQNHSAQAYEFTHRWGEKFQTDTHIKLSGDNSLRFTCDLSRIRMYGMNEVLCLLLGGDDINTADAVREFRQRLGDSGGLPFVLAASQSAYEQAQS